MKIFWHTGTRDDFAAIRLYYDQIDPAIANDIIAAIFKITRHLAEFPELGRPGRVRQTQELPIKGTKFLIAYMADEQRLIILAVYHASRQWPETWLKAAVKAGLDAVDRGEFATQQEVKKKLLDNEREDNNSNTNL